MRRAGSPLHVYAHLPVCRTRCPYCDFSVTVGESDTQQRFVDGLRAEMNARQRHWEGRRPDSLYVGGGTPSVVSAEALDRLVDDIEAAFGEFSEVTVEANPEDVLDDAAWAGRLPQSADRVILGVQSFDDDVLTRIGRRHDADASRASIERVVESGASVGVDLLFGIPGQSLTDWESELDALASLVDSVDLISGWELSWDRFEPPEAFHSVIEDVGARPSTGIRRSMLDSLDAFATQHGLEKREVGVYARPEVRRRYMEGRRRGHECLGLGPGAHGLALSEHGIFQQSRGADPVAYLDDPTGRPDTSELSPREFLFVRICQGLELTDGLSVAGLHEQFDPAFGSDRIDKITDELLERASDLVERAGVDGRVRLVPTPAGLASSDRVATQVAALIPS